ncbi:hypothetical protein BDY19DRAFT_528999 [Irpex rosettiformis]|uniref:Uncharacterized protein n=1 Tax=Irpex rosettiformis TaxID=378272 RepID=A0ACB8TRD0_9APHY|nr:hypothetical protein BDY19DRAFT_528999 [Irpex rosettiformis]
MKASVSSQTALSSLTTIVLMPFAIFTFFAVELPIRLFIWVLNTLYVFLERIIVLFFKPPPPKPNKSVKYRGRIAVVGAGITGISSAAHAISHGFDVVIYEKSDRIGGIWAAVNETSGLQLNSLLYRFHPALVWKHGFPQRDEILKEISRIHHEYALDQKTRYNAAVKSIRRAQGSGKPSNSELGNTQSRWIVNKGEDGEFDAVIVTVGTCGDPNMVKIKGMPGWKNEKKRKHESELENKQKKKKKEDVKSEGGSGLHEISVKEDRPTQDDSNRTTDNVWDQNKPPVNEWDLGRDQVDKMDQGFPKPDEAYHVGDDTQMPVQEVAKEGVHKQVRGDVVGHKHHGKTSRPEHPETENGEGHDDNDDNVFKRPIIHSSQLDHGDAPDFQDKTIVVIGSGASAVEAVETALAKGAKKCIVIARQDKWIIPRNIIIDTLVSAQPFGRETPLSFMWEKFITWYNYRGVKDLSPANVGLFEGTPVVNDEFLGHVRKGKCDYVRGDTERLTSRGVRVNVRQRGSKPGDDGEIKEFDADIVVMATGFHKPKIDFLPDDLFPEGYERPNLYLQNFSTEDWSVLMTNSSYINAIGTVGHFHIGIYVRILMTFLMDKDARPTPKDMKLWVDVVRFIKRGARGGALGFFTYMELSAFYRIYLLPIVMPC